MIYKCVPPEKTTEGFRRTYVEYTEAPEQAIEYMLKGYAVSQAPSDWVAVTWEIKPVAAE